VGEEEKKSSSLIAGKRRRRCDVGSTVFFNTGEGGEKKGEVPGDALGGKEKRTVSSSSGLEA